MCSIPITDSSSRARAVAADSAAAERRPSSRPRKPLPTCACSPTSTFSSAVSSGNRPPFWNVRRAPRAEISCGVSPAISSPRNRMLPPSATTLPDTALNSVVLPAPFGPINAQISPACRSNETPPTATRPPKRTVTSRTDSNGASATIVALDEGWMQACKQACEPARQEQDDEDDQQAEHQFIKTGKADEHLRRRCDDGGADDCAGDAGKPPYHDNRELADQLREIERDRREMPDRDREHRATHADDGAAPREGENDVAVSGNAHRGGGNLVVLDRQEGAAEARTQQSVGDRDDQHD